MVSRQTIVAVGVQVKSGTKESFTGMWTVLTAVWLVLYLVSELQKIYPNNNTTCEYCPVPNTSIVLTLVITISSLTFGIWWLIWCSKHLGTFSVCCHTNTTVCHLNIQEWDQLTVGSSKYRKWIMQVICYRWSAHLEQPISCSPIFVSIILSIHRTVKVLFFGLTATALVVFNVLTN